MTPFPSEGIATERLVIRRVHTNDGDALWRRRNHPEVARYQSWTLPFPREGAAELVGEMAGHDGVPAAGWSMVTIAERDSGPPGDDSIVGDLAVNRSFGGRTAEIGFTLSPQHWGRGYATEAAGALVDWLFGHTRVARVHGQLHPDNIASAMVLERLGFLFEGHTRQSYWVGDECSDDWLYGLTRADWEAWRHRPTSPPEALRLVEITSTNQRAVAALVTHKTQERFVAPVARSYGDVLFPSTYQGHPVEPWLRAVEADGELAGFVLLVAPSARLPVPHVWRFLIDRRHQGRGIGTRVLDLLVEQCRAWGASAIDLTWVEGRGSPAPMYLRYGFEPTGRIVDDEVEARLDL